MFYKFLPTKTRFALVTHSFHVLCYYKWILNLWRFRLNHRSGWKLIRKKKGDCQRSLLLEGKEDEEDPQAFTWAWAKCNAVFKLGRLGLPASHARVRCRRRTFSKLLGFFFEQTKAGGSTGKSRWASQNARTTIHIWIEKKKHPSIKLPLRKRRKKCLSRK